MASDLEFDNLAEEQKKVFWDLIDTFNTKGLLTYLMLIGSWAELIYDKYYFPNYSSSIRTRDVDFFYKNINVPAKNTFDIVSILKEKGFTCETDRLSDVSKFVMEDFLTIEFLVRVLGSGDKPDQKIPSLGIVGSGIRDINMLERYPLDLECGEYTIAVPEPEAYILQKLIINPNRKKQDKKEKDLQSIRCLLPHVDKVRLRDIFDKLTDRQRITINEVCETNFIDLW